MMKLIFFFATLVLSSQVFAAGGHGDGIPTKTIILQALNVGMFVGALFFLLKGVVKRTFTARATDYEAAAKRAEELKAEAETKRKEMEDKLRALEDSATKTIENARAEAEKLKASMIAEGKEVSDRIRSEAEKSTQQEVARAKEELRQSLLLESMDATRKAIASNLSESDQKRLQGEFVEKFQAVRQ